MRAVCGAFPGGAHTFWPGLQHRSRQLVTDGLEVNSGGVLQRLFLRIGAHSAFLSLVEGRPFPKFGLFFLILFFGGTTALNLLSVIGVELCVHVRLSLQSHASECCRPSFKLQPLLYVCLACFSVETREVLCSRFLSREEVHA